MRKLPPILMLAAALVSAACSGGGDIPAPYAGFVSANSAFSRPVPGEALNKMFLNRSVLRPSPLPLNALELRAAITEGLNIGFMTGGLASRPLRVTEAGDSDRGDYIQRKLLFTDPFIGELEASLLIPARRAIPAAAILGLPGHGDTAQTFEEQRLGAALARAGYLVLIPVFRVYSLDGTETDLSLRLLRSGFTLMGIRVYETLLALKYLRALPAAAPSRIGILCHSGGCAVGALTARLADGISAQVSDYRIDYLPADFETANSEHLPGIFPLSGAINNAATLPFPHLTVPYGLSAPGSRERVLAFFSASLLRRGPMPLEDDPTAEELLALARIELRAGNRKAALAALDKAAGSGPGTSTLPRLADLYAQLGKHRRAEELLKRTGGPPEDPNLLISLAGTAAGAGDKRLALSRLFRAESSVLTAEDRHRIAITYQDLKEYDRALVILRGLAAENPGEAVFLADLGLCEYLSGDASSAENHLRAAIGLAPASLSAYLSLGAIYSAAGRDEEALKLYDQALSTKPTEPNTALLAAITERRSALRH